MRWALNVVGVTGKTIRSMLEAERDHFLKTSPIPTDDLDRLNSAIRVSYNGPKEATDSLIMARDKEIRENPHPDTPVLIEQMNGTIAAVEALLKATEQSDEVNVALSGHINDQVSAAAPGLRNSRDKFGDRVSINCDFVRSGVAPASHAAPSKQKVDE